MTNRDQLQNLKHALRWTDQQIADYLAETTMRPCSVHAVRGWLAHPDRLYARRCPDWAVMLLADRLEKESP